MVKNNSNKSIHVGGWPWSNDVSKSSIINDDLNAILKKENEKTRFQFTRHLLSCNNLDEGKWYTAGKDNEPGGTIYGITKTIKYAKDEKVYFYSNHVYVSNLYRTWITAVLLYGVNLSQDKTLNLYVSPHLKEYHGIIQRGNFPKEINHMAHKFLKFLNALFNIKDIIPADNKDIIPADINNLPNTIILHLPPKPDDKDKPTKPQLITYNKEENAQIYTMNKPCDIVDTSGPNSGVKFTETGDLNDFMAWHNGNNYYNSPVQVEEQVQVNKPVHVDEPVHVVTHSHIMRDYLASFQIEDAGGIQQFDLDKLKSNAVIKGIRNSNSWHFNTKINNQFSTSTTTIASAITHFDLKEGVPIKKDDAKKLEKEYQSLSLCGINGSVSVPTDKDCTDPAIVTLSAPAIATPSALVTLSGGKTRKKRRHKTKKRMNKSRNGHKKKTRVNKSRKRSK